MDVLNIALAWAGLANNTKIHANCGGLSKHCILDMHQLDREIVTLVRMAGKFANMQTFEK